MKGPSPNPPAPNPAVSAALSLWRRDLVRFFRQRSRVVGAVATPVVFWAMLGFGLDRLVTVGGPGDGAAGTDGTGYLAYFYPGMIVLMVLFTAIFATIGVIEERREGFLQGVLASPAPRSAIVMGKVAGAATIAGAQGLVLLAGWPVIASMTGLSLGGVFWIGLAAAAVLLPVLAGGVAAFGLCLAWRSKSVAGYHAVMNLILMPMWFLCGAVFPLATAGPLRPVMWANPLTYGYTAFASPLHGFALPGGVMPWWSAGATMLLLSVMAVLVAVRVVARPLAAD